MGKGSGGCDERSAMVCSTTEPVSVGLGDFTRQEEFCKIFLHDKEVINVSCDIVGAKREYYLYSHCSIDYKEIFYDCYDGNEVPDVSDHAIGLLGGISFPSMNAFSKAVEGIIGERVHYELGMITYTTEVENEAGQVRLNLHRDVNTHQWGMALKIRRYPTYLHELQYKELKGYKTRQAAIEATNKYLSMGI